MNCRSAEIRIGKSVVVSCVGILALEIIAVAYTRRLAPRLFERGAPIGVDEG